MDINIIIGLFIIAIGSFCQSSCYVPINKIKEWSWESYWLVQGFFAWLIFPFLGTIAAIPEGNSISELLLQTDTFHLLMTILFGVLWGVGGLTFGLSMRYLGVALGQSISLGTCAALGTIMGPVILNTFYPELNPMKQLTGAVMIGVLVTLIGIAIIGIAGAMRAATLAPESSKANKKGNSFYKGIIIALLCGFMSGCFNVGLTFGQNIHFTATPALFHTLPATFLVTLGGFFTNAVYCLYQNNKNHTWGDYAKGNTWGNNLVFCILAGGLWYSQFFGLSLGKNFLLSSPALLTLSFCILMALNVVFSNIWGIILQEWKGCSKKVIAILILGVIILMISPFIPQLI